MADEFAVELKRCHGVARDFNRFRLKIGLATGAEVAAENEVHYVAGEGGPLEFWEDCDIKAAVAQVGFVEEWVFAGVEFAVADEDEIALFRSVGAANDHGRFGRVQRAESSPDVGEAADALFQLPTDKFDCARIPTSAGHLQEAARAGFVAYAKRGFGEVDAAFLSSTYNLPGGVEVEGNGEFESEDVNGAERDDAKFAAFVAVGRVADAVDNFVKGAVAAGRDDRVETFLDGGFGEFARGAGVHGRAHFGVGRKFAELFAEIAGFIAFGGWIENDAGAHGLSNALSQMGL